MVITILTFCNGMYSSANTPGKNALIVGWAAVSYILWGMCYTVGDIPLWGVTSRMTEVEKDRASILSFARIAAGLGGGVVLQMGLNANDLKLFSALVVALFLGVPYWKGQLSAKHVKTNKGDKDNA